jgi:hypothetical protein
VWVARPPGEAMAQALRYQVNYIAELNNPAQGETAHCINYSGFMALINALQAVEDAVGLDCFRFLGVLYEVNKERLMWKLHPFVCDLVSATKPLVGI